jgi:hypothetical protein
VLLQFAATFRMWLPVAGYLGDVQAYQASCENKALPMLNCNGKCVLAKKMAEMAAHSAETERAPQMVQLTEQDPCVVVPKTVFSAPKQAFFPTLQEACYPPVPWSEVLNPPPEA